MEEDDDGGGCFVVSALSRQDGRIRTGIRIGVGVGVGIGIGIWIRIGVRIGIWIGIRKYIFLLHVFAFEINEPQKKGETISFYL